MKKREFSTGTGTGLGEAKRRGDEDNKARQNCCPKFDSRKNNILLK
jgi:hypothetical protein